jgi:hypothetical protein
VTHGTEKNRPSVIAWISLGVGLLAVWLTLRNFQVTQRPYVGVFDAKYSVVEGPPRGIRYYVTLKNVGALPAFARVTRHEGTVTKNTSVTNFSASEIPARGPMFIMPGQTYEMPGIYVEGAPYSVSIADLLEGRASWDIYLDVDYESAGLFGTTTHHYSGHLLLHAQTPLPPLITTISTRAD